MRHSSVFHPRDRQFVSGTGETPVAAAPFRKGPAGGGALGGLLLNESRVGSAARRRLLLRRTEAEESSTGKVCTILPEFRITGIYVLHIIIGHLFCLLGTYSQEMEINCVHLCTYLFF